LKKGEKKEKKNFKKGISSTKKRGKGRRI